ncbi:hypothetical protein J9B83_14625 [Marinomonas sp. A79]|uniref:TIGR02646 family protein n=1 Tax=Marinomonas vulgaris TaxID=2823372 RepID=A0ABS5HER5_9GAMM|nr:hypothetical protein [Marinomonas vulgaris]MBR7890146.1 hypothetical protein [Marinomonas vulgaris]
MKEIIKRLGFEPEVIKKWKKHNPIGQYSDLGEVEREAIRSECSSEQYYLCAYCCKKISGSTKDTMNEHVEARRIAPQRSLDFSNIVASCRTFKQCDDAHGSQPLPFSPLVKACESELSFTLSGKIIGLTDRAKEAIKILNLGDELTGNRSLIEQRKQLVTSLLLCNGVDPEDGIEDNEILKMLIQDLSTPKDGELEAFSPAAISVLKQWVS